MMKFNDIWTEFSWILNELNGGMVSFKGYIPSVLIFDVEHPLQELLIRHDSV
jgi:hypothetical protein